MGTKFIIIDAGSRCRFLGCHRFHFEVLWGPCYKEGHGEQITYGHLIANNIHIIEVLTFSEKLLFFSVKDNKKISSNAILVHLSEEHKKNIFKLLCALDR